MPWSAGAHSSPLAGEGRIDSLEFREGKVGAAGHQSDLLLLQVATLRDDDQVALISLDFVRLVHVGESRADDRDRAARQVVSLNKWTGFGIAEVAGRSIRLRACGPRTADRLSTETRT